MRIVDSHRSLESNDENFGVSYNQRNGYQFYLTDGELPGLACSQLFYATFAALPYMKYLHYNISFLKICHQIIVLPSTKLFDD